MNSIRERIINNGTVPIISLEGSKCLIEEYVRYITKEKGKYDTRRIALSSYKKPNDSSVIVTKDEEDEYTFRIVMLLIDKMRQMSALNGNINLYNSLPNYYKLRFSYEQFNQIFNMSEEEIMKEIKRFNSADANATFLGKLISISILSEDRIGKVVEVPYGNDKPHDKNADYRIYINTPNGKNRYEFLVLFIKKCIDRSIPYEMKGLEHADDHKDRTIIYCFDEYFDETVQVLEEIKRENPELVSDMGTPIASGLNWSYYAIATNMPSKTYNDWFNRISSHAINYLCANLIKSDIGYYSRLSEEEKSQIDQISNIHNYSFNSEGFFTGASNPIVNDYIVKNKERIMQPEIFQRLSDSLKMMCSLGNFNDLDHCDFPISLDSKFYKSLEMTVESKKEEKTNDVGKKERYLYETEGLLKMAYEEFLISDLSNEERVLNYINRVKKILNNFRRYALKEPGFVESERYKEFILYVQSMPSVFPYKEDKTKNNYINTVMRKRHYDNMAKMLESFSIGSNTPKITLS